MRGGWPLLWGHASTIERVQRHKRRMRACRKDKGVGRLCSVWCTVSTVLYSTRVLLAKSAQSSGACAWRVVPCLSGRALLSFPRSSISMQRMEPSRASLTCHASPTLLYAKPYSTLLYSTAHICLHVSRPAPACAKLAYPPADM